MILPVLLLFLIAKGCQAFSRFPPLLYTTTARGVLLPSSTGTGTGTCTNGFSRHPNVVVVGEIHSHFHGAPRPRTFAIFSEPSSLASSIDGETSLKDLFAIALERQAQGKSKEALEAYDVIIKASKQFQLEDAKVAQIYLNMGALCLSEKNYQGALDHLEKSLQYHEVGLVHVNLAVLQFEKAGNVLSRKERTKFLLDAKGHCEAAIRLNDRPVALAKRLLRDVEGMLRLTNQEK